MHPGRTVERSGDDQYFGPFDGGACIVTAREPEAGHGPGPTEQTGPDHHARAPESGKLRPVIDKRYSLGEVPDAIRYLEEKHARGKVVVTLE